MPALPNVPFVSIDSARVAVDAPVSTDLMTDIAVDLNYLKSAADLLGAPNIVNFLATTTWTVPAGITRITARMFGGGPGAGGGADNSFPGNVGGAGGDSWVGTSANKARGGLGGGGGLVGGGSNAAGSAQAPVFGANSVQYGTLAGTPTSGSSHIGATGTWQLPNFGLPSSAPGGAPSTVGTAGTANTGQSGGGGGGATGGTAGGGATGSPGEYAEWNIAVTPGSVLTITVGGAGAGGIHGGGGTSAAGGAGGTGFVQILY